MSLCKAIITKQRRNKVEGRKGHVKKELIARKENFEFLQLIRSWPWSDEDGGNLCSTFTLVLLKGSWYLGRFSGLAAVLVKVRFLMSLLFPY